MIDKRGLAVRDGDGWRARPEDFTLPRERIDAALTHLPPIW
ncbi:hypothetical protein OG320_04365 [Microbispora sp. NBC_01189]|nr:hypothetical protein OG320_04365 [Microbispora sp. NBC_01189]